MVKIYGAAGIFNVTKKDFKTGKVSGYLKIYSKDGTILLKVWCNSGGFGKGPLPKGEYVITRDKKLSSNVKYIKAFTDPDKKYWYFRLTPVGLVAKLLAKLNRYGFLIHTDNPPEGTQGCIGVTITDYAYRSANDILSRVVSKYGSIPLEVVYSIA